ncbi:MAG: hypothetical protein ACK4GL_11505 [Flavobacteriales bacterium]
MKKHFNFIRRGVMMMFLTLSLQAQTSEKLLLMPVDLIGLNVIQEKQLEHLSGVARLKIELSGKYQLIDHYEMKKAKITKEQLLSNTLCLTNMCLIETGKAMQANKVLSGYIENLGPKLIVSFQLLDVKNGAVEKKLTKEFLNIITEADRMIEITLNEMFGIPNNQDIVTKLTKRNDFDNVINSPYRLRLRADGPRMGLTLFTGKTADIITSPRSEGGYGVYPWMFQFGYQLEKQYLNEGNFQALAEFIPMITGFDQGLVIPSFTFLNGFRDNKRGWEIAFGPSFSVVNRARGFFDAAGRWNLISIDNPLPDGAIAEYRLDSRGRPEINAGFVIAAGKTFKSGKLNMPLNVFVVPQREGVRYGISFGFNAKGRYSG